MHFIYFNYVIYFYNDGNNILRLLILYQIFFSPQVKRSVIICNKYGIYEFRHEFPERLKT